MQSHCTICLENHPIDVFRFLPCGHGFCVESLTGYVGNNAGPRAPKKTCPICRDLFRLHDVHPIYLVTDHAPSPQGQPNITSDTTDYAEHHQVRYSKAALKQANHVARAIREVDATKVSAEQVRELGTKVEKVAGGLGGGSSHVETLLSAIADFWKRIVPVVATASEQEKELKALGEERRAIEVENRRLRDEADKARQLASQAVDTADQAHHEVVRWREENDKLGKRFTEKQTEHSESLATKAQEISDLKDKLLAHKKKEQQRIEKINKLKEQVEEQDSIIEDLRRAAVRTPVKPQRQFLLDPSQFSSRSTQESIYIAPYTDENIDSEFDLGLEYVDLASPRPLPSLFLDVPDTTISAQRPKFASDWTLDPPRKRKRENSATTFPIQVDAKGQVKGIVQLGSRQRLSFK
ncbi:hypothetical protein SCP_1601850 [Sparassis crispa]|uniref:RING-type domain-containing protein n=1 Tax=Sparassis crispa TaxID=139825 RepID=A0A401H547_9APHY|nr:hypothetical protein SCP_1601850 [Sparassis crispa]GBE89523.1 hypothetical protein SCP_1601850 [Sparassis crispa]